MATLKELYGSWTDITLTLASLATDANLLAGRASTAVDNSTNLYLDALLAGRVTVGTSPTAGTIEVWLYGAIASTPSYPDGITGTDANKTITSDNVKQAGLKLAKVIQTGTTSDRSYDFGPISVARHFGGLMPDHWGVFVVHDTGVNLNATGSNHFVRYRGVHLQSV